MHGVNFILVRTTEVRKSMTEKEKYHGTRPEISQGADYYILYQHEEDIMLLIQMQKEDLTAKKTIGCD